MSAKTAPHLRPAAGRVASPTAGPWLQRRCACGTSGVLLGGECADCGKKRRRAPQTKLRIGRAGDAFEREADRIAEQVVQDRPAPKVRSRAVASVQRNGPDADSKPPVDAPTRTEGALESGDAAGGAATGQTPPAPVCAPKALKRVDYLKEPGTSSNDFGLTALDASAATIPAVVTAPVKGGVQIQPTTAALPTIPSVYTAADSFTEGEAHFVGGGGRSPCPSGKKPIRWIITPKGADKIREGELDHCADFQLALDMSLRRYADAVNALAGKRTFASQRAAEQALKTAVGVHPNDWFDAFVCLARKTRVRDRQNWHTPKPMMREPRLDANCEVVYAWVTENSLPGVGQAQHPAADIIKDCGEAGPVKPGPGAGKVDAPHALRGPWEPWAEGETEETLMQRRAASNDGAEPLPSAAPALVEQVIASPGQALDGATRAFMEPRFERDFSDVRVHLDGPAARSVEAVDALAYTVGRHVVFGAGAFSPGSAAGRRLLAHELTHVVQQTGSGARALARQPRGRTDFRRDNGLVDADDLSKPEFLAWLGGLSRAGLRDYRALVEGPAVRRYIDMLLVPGAVAGVETHTVQQKAQDVEKIDKASYWRQLVLREFEVTVDTDRLDKSAEERDAVYAALWQAAPSRPVASAASATVEIPANKERAAALLYRFDFASRTAGHKLDAAQIHFLLERPGRIATPAREPPHGPKVPEVSFNAEIGFDRGADPYFKRYPDERRQVDFAVQQASGAFDLMVQTRSNGGGKARPHEATIRLRGRKDAQGQVQNLDIERMTEGRFRQAELPPDYRHRDFGDLLIEDAQTKPSSKGDTLGHVELGNVPPAERVAVKQSIVSYFDNPNKVIASRNVEVNAVVPIPHTRQRVFYKFFFRADNEVDVQRIGVEGESAKLDPDALDVSRVEGFDAHSASAADLGRWLGKRYPALKPDGATVAEVQASANKALQAGAGTAEWFRKQYSIFPLAATDLSARLTRTHGLSAKAAAGTKDLERIELEHIERGMQTPSDAMVSQLAQLRLGRQAQKLGPDGAPDDEALPDGTRQRYSGTTYHNGSSRTIVYFDGLLGAATPSTFRGDAERVNRSDTHIVLHEFGHVIDDKTGARAAFNAFVKKEGIAPFTAYAQRNQEKEFFEEAFADFQINPSGMVQAHPRLHQWFTLLTRSGKPPDKLP